jgi:hypothetical protein
MIQRKLREAALAIREGNSDGDLLIDHLEAHKKEVNVFVNFT